MATEVLLVGTGRMGQEYGLVLKEMKIRFTAVGRGDQSAALFEARTGIKPVTGGIEPWLKLNTIPSVAIIAVKVVDLFSICRTIIDSGIKTILLEKPGALYYKEIKELAEIASETGTNIFIGYNRRFFGSVIEAARILREDGGVLSFNFEFTEWSDRVEVFDTDKEEKSRWFLSNSSHVADLAFYLGGKPAEMKAFTSGSLTWHKNSSAFCGSGITVTGALFSYSANWNAPGRWGVEFLSENYRIILRPLEKLHVQKKGSLVPEQVHLSDSYDVNFKPGLYRMVESLIHGKNKDLCTLEEQAELFDFYCSIANYK